VGQAGGERQAGGAEVAASARRDAGAQAGCASAAHTSGGLTVLELLASKNQALLVRRDALLILDLQGAAKTAVAHAKVGGT
jgi:hypothetical protein